MALILSLLLVLSVVLRAPFISSVPPELFGDELDVGYQAYSLLHTGRDLYGQILPTYIHSLSEWRTPLLMYATIPTIAVFGLTELGVRLPEVIFGSLGAPVLFLAVYFISKSKPLALFSGLFLALLPWHIIYSRTAFEVVILLNLILLGTLLFTRRHYLFSTIFFALAFYAYSTAVLFVPLWLILLHLILKRRPVWTEVFLFLLLLPFASNVITGRAQGRFSQISIFNQSETIAKINNFRLGSSGLAEPLFHNRLESYLQLFLNNYLGAFSTNFLFVRGDPVARHSLQVVGQLLPITAPLLLLGLYYLAKGRHYLWLSWLFLAPLPSAFTQDGGFHATRLILMVPPLAVSLGAGLIQFLSFFPRDHRRLVSFFISLPLLAQLVWVGHYYMSHYPRMSWRWWPVGYKAAIRELIRLSPNYSRVYLNNTYEPSLIRFLFYSAYSPALFQSQFILDQPQTGISPNYDGFRLGDKYYFGTFSDTARKLGITPFLEPGALYLISQADEVPGNWDWRSSPPSDIRILFTSTTPNNQPLFYLVTRQ